MQYVRSLSGSVSKTWNSINPATLSGAIDVIVVEKEDGILACSPFHVRFGKFSLLRPSDKKVEFRVNDVKQDYAMKLGEGGEAFFVFETTDSIPELMRTSPLVSPSSSPPIIANGTNNLNLSEPDFLDLDTADSKSQSGSPYVAETAPNLARISRNNLYNIGSSDSYLASPEFANEQIIPRVWDDKYKRPHSETNVLFSTNPSKDVETTNRSRQTRSLTPSLPGDEDDDDDESRSLHSLPTKEAIDRALVISERLLASNIPTQVTITGDLMLDMTGYKSSEENALRAEIIARKILSDELEGKCDAGALFGADEHGNLWIYSSEESKEAAGHSTGLTDISSRALRSADMISDLGYSSEENDMSSSNDKVHRRTKFDIGLETPPQTPPESIGDQSRNYAKTLRLTSDQLKALNLKNGPNPVTFTVNKATCQAYMYLWRHDVPIVISDIDGTITKSDALGHVLNMIGRDWTHAGVAKLYTDISNNGYNIMYLTSRSIGQADTTRAYLNGVVQESYRLPKGPTIMSPDRTIAALRRELYIRKPEVFKMACLRDIKSLFGQSRAPFYAGFGNRFTDALSYRSVSIPSNRIFTINSYAEVSLDLLSLNKLRYSYVNMREVVDHYFPPVNMLINPGGEEYTDFTYWREPILEIDDFSDSESDEGEYDDDINDDINDYIDDEYEDSLHQMNDSYNSQDYIDDSTEECDISNLESHIDFVEDEITEEVEHVTEIYEPS